MYYAIFGTDKPNSLALRKQVRPAHIERIGELVSQGRLLTAGPHPANDQHDPGDAGFTGSLIIAEFDSQLEAERWAEQDPYWTEGVFDSVVVKPYKQVLPE
ncbi:MAG: YciI family protein [Pseudomonadota bacterium]